MDNNPFPLYEGEDRKVMLGFGRLTSVSHLVPQASGHAHVKPFFTCPAGDYPYAVSASAVTPTITATPLGFGAPSFAWSINGTPLAGAGQAGDTVSTAVGRFLRRRNGHVSAVVRPRDPRARAAPHVAVTDIRRQRGQRDNSAKRFPGTRDFAIYSTIETRRG